MLQEVNCVQFKYAKPKYSKNVVDLLREQTFQRRKEQKQAVGTKCSAVQSKIGYIRCRRRLSERKRLLVCSG